MLVLGIDIGTTGAKAAVFDSSGKQYGYDFAEYGVISTAPGLAEQDGETIWHITKKVIAGACKEYGSEIIALSLSVQGDAVTAVDSSLRPLIPFQLGMDYRCTEQAAAFTSEFGDEYIFRHTGIIPHPMNTICKIRYICEKMPDIAAKTYKFMTFSDYLLTKLGADTPTIDYTMASRTMAADISTLAWIPGILSSAGISKEKLSSPVPSGTIVGTLTKSLSEELGIRPKALLVAGGHDQTLAALGAGLLHPGTALDSHGTAEVISTPLIVPKLDTEMFMHSFPCYAYALPGMYFTFSLNHTAGILLKWWAEGYCQQDYDSALKSDKSIYSYLIEHADQKPSHLLVLPGFQGNATPNCDLNARGAILGLTLSTTRQEVAKAILEALCFNMKENLAALCSSNIPIEQLRCVGGGARTPSGLQLKADICGCPIYTLHIREAACLGAAMLAGIAAGVWSSPQEAADIVSLEREYLPDPKKNKIYNEHYQYYLEAIQANREIFHYLTNYSTKNT